VIIKEFHIKKYGPIGFRQPFRPSNFTIFYGENESGKTLTIEAILKILAGKKEAKEKNYVNIDRVKEFPEGYIVLENDERQIRIVNGEFLKEFEISHEELKNVIIIRNSDLSIESPQRNKEPEIYSKVTEKLVGSAISKIQSVKGKILEKSIITETGILKDQKEARYKQRLEKAKVMIEDINKLIYEIESNNSDYFELEEQIRTTQAKVEHLNKKLKNMQISKEKSICNELLEDIDKLKLVINKLKNYELHTPDNLQKFAEFQLEIDKLNRKIEELQEKINNFDEELNSNSKQMKEIESTIPSLREKAIKAEKLKEAILKYQSQLIEPTKLRQNKYLWTILSITMLLVTTISLIAALGPVFKTILSAIGFGISVFALAKFLEINRIITNLEQSKREILKDGKEIFKTMFNDIESLEETCSKAIDQYNDTIRMEQNLRETIIEVQEQKEKLEKDIRASNDTLLRTQEAFKNFKEQLSVKSIEELKEKLNEKSDLEQEYQKLKSQIFTRIRTSNIKLNEIPNDLSNLYDSEIIQKLTKIENSVHNYLQVLKSQEEKEVENAEEKIETHKSGNSEEELKNTIEALQKNLENMRNRQRQTQERMKFILANVQREGLLEDYFEEIPDIVYGSDLIKLREELQNLVENITERQEIEYRALRILQQIEEEERQSISDIFKQSNLIKIFTEITEGKYVNISYERNEGVGQIKIKDANGFEFTPEQLSAGTYDQLYFSIRLALAEHLFGKNSGEKAFFILDDPFIKYDKKRLEKQIHKLVELSNQGWQFLYFTAKDEVVEIGEKIGIDIIKLEEFIEER